MTLLQEAVQAWRKGLSSPAPKMYGHSVDGNGAVKQRHGCGAGVFMPTWAKVLGFHLLLFWGAKYESFSYSLSQFPPPLKKKKMDLPAPSISYMEISTSGHSRPRGPKPSKPCNQ